MRERSRLRNTRDIQRVRRAGGSRGDAIYVVSAVTNDVGWSRLAVSTPARLGGAVQRNRARRRARAVFAPLLDRLSQPSDLHVVVREAAARASFEDLVRSARGLLEAHGLLAKTS